jgi:SH3-like domain-containing protein
MIRMALSITVAALLLAPQTARAEEGEVPYWVTLTADKVNMRVGPARDYRIAWHYRRDGLPLKVVRLHEGWRLVEDPDGARGWILSRFLSRARGALVRGTVAEIRDKPSGGRLLWRAEPGVVGRLGDCEAGWCKFDAGGRKGWIAASAIWGEGEP